jgi:Ni/Co efflux regulator RcnB
MRFRPLVAAMTAGSLLLGNVAAFAQAEVAQDRFNKEQAQRDARRAQGHREDQRATNQRYDSRYYQQWDEGQHRYTPVEHTGADWRGRGAGPDHDWYRGSYVPREYRGRNYVVDDWRAHHLYAPPAGYHWVQAPGGDYVLAAIATGLIASILLNH